MKQLQLQRSYVLSAKNKGGLPGVVCLNDY